MKRKEMKKRVRIGYVPASKETGKMLLSNDRTLQTYKTKKEAKEKTLIIRSLFGVSMEYLPVYVETKMKVKW